MLNSWFKAIIVLFWNRMSCIQIESWNMTFLATKMLFQMIETLTEWYSQIRRVRKKKTDVKVWSTNQFLFTLSGVFCIPTFYQLDLNYRDRFPCREGTGKEMRKVVVIVYLCFLLNCRCLLLKLEKLPPKAEVRQIWLS